MEVQGAVIVLTGASSGIGKAAAELLARAGAKLVVAARSGDRLEALAKSLVAEGCDVVPVVTDTTVPADVSNLIARTKERFGRIDVLVNNAGVSAMCPLEKQPDDVFRRMFEVNVLGTLRAMREVIPVMRAQGGGLIVNVSSMTSKDIWPSLGAYAATKFAINGLTETMRVEGKKDNIRVSLVFPDGTDTELVEHALLVVDPPTAAPEGVTWVQDTPEYVGQKILETIRHEPAECYMR